MILIQNCMSVSAKEDPDANNENKNFNSKQPWPTAQKQHSFLSRKEDREKADLWFIEKDACTEIGRNLHRV